jgi:hypothetical protein
VTCRASLLKLQCVVSGGGEDVDDDDDEYDEDPL